MTSAASTISYQGISNTGAADMRISLPKTGWSLISLPFESPVLWSEVLVTNGSSTLSQQDAIAAGWIGRIAFTWDNQTSNFGYVGTGARGSRFDDSLRPWHAYWISTYRDDLALIVPAP